MRQLAAIFALLLTASQTVSFPTGPPVDLYPFVCSTLDPNSGLPPGAGDVWHGPSSVEGTPIPYEIIVDGSTYIYGGQLGNILEVTLRVADDEPDTIFKGFILQARGATGVEPVGYWRNVPANTQGLTCGGPVNSLNGRCADPLINCGNTWAHLNNEIKTSVTAQWVAPISDVGNIYFRATVVTGPNIAYYKDFLSSNAPNTLTPISATCPASDVVIWEYMPGYPRVPFYYTENNAVSGFEPLTVVVNAGEERQLYCTSYESRPATYISWSTPTERLGPNLFVSNDCAITIVESEISAQFPVTKYDTTKCVDLEMFDLDWHRAEIQCTAANEADWEGVDSVPVSLFLCVPCEVNLHLEAYNFLGDPYELSYGSVIPLDANGSPKTIKCVNRGARGLEPGNRPWLEFHIKEAGSYRYENLTEADGVQFVYERHLYDPNDPEYSKVKYENLWEVRKDITLSAESRFNLEGAVLSCYCRNRVYRQISEARREVTLKIYDTPLIAENFILDHASADISDRYIFAVTYGPFDSTDDRKRRQASEDSLQLTCTARGTRPAVDIVWRLDGDIVSDHYIDVSIQDSVLNIGPSQDLVDTVSTLTLDPVSRDLHYKNVTCEAPSGNDGLLVRAVTIIVLSPPDTPLELYGEHQVAEGETVSLECEAYNGYPEGAFRWRDVARDTVVAGDKEETEVLDNNRYYQESYYRYSRKKLKSKSSPTSDIPLMSFVASREDNGRLIRCELIQDYDEYGFTSVTTQDIIISVNYCPTMEAELIGCPNSPIVSGQSVTFSCQSGITNPASYIAYLVDDVVLPPAPPSSTTDVGYGQSTTLQLTRAFTSSDDGVQVRCCHRTAINGMVCPELCSYDCTINIQEEIPIPPEQGCRWVRARFTLENINGNLALWDDVYENRLSPEYQVLHSRLIDIFHYVYAGLTDHRRTVIPSIRRSVEGHIQVIIGLEFLYPYGTSTATIREALTSRLDDYGVIVVNGGDGAYGFDVLDGSIGEECVCPQNDCLRGPSCTPSPEDYSSSCQCPINYAPPRCEGILAPPDPPTRAPERGVTYARLVLVISEFNDRPVFWDPVYDDLDSYQAIDIRNELQTVLYRALTPRFPCLETVTVADFFAMHNHYLAVIIGMEFSYDCGNSINEIRNAFIQSVDVDGKIDGSSVELKQDFVMEIGLEEVCGAYFYCANEGVCEPSVREYSNYCRCPRGYEGPRCDDIVDNRPTRRPPPPRPTGTGKPESQQDEQIVIIIIVAAVIGGAIFIILVGCISLYCCRPTVRRTHYVDRSRSHRPSHRHHGRRRGSPPRRTPYDRNHGRSPYDRNYDRKAKLIY